MQLKLYATHPTPFQRQTSPSLIVCLLAYSKLLKLSAASNAGGVHVYQVALLLQRLPERPRDALCPSVVSLNKIITRAEFFLLLLLSLQIYHCVTLSSAWRWDVLSYTSSLFPAINKLGRLPATSGMKSPWSVSAKCISRAAGMLHSSQWSQIYWLRIAISAYPTCIQRPRYEGSRQNIAVTFGTEKLEWCGYPMVKKFWRYVHSFW